MCCREPASQPASQSGVKTTHTLHKSHLQTSCMSSSSVPPIQRPVNPESWAHDNYAFSSLSQAVLCAGGASRIGSHRFSLPGPSDVREALAGASTRTPARRLETEYELLGQAWARLEADRCLEAWTDVRKQGPTTGCHSSRSVPGLERHNKPETGTWKNHGCERLVLRHGPRRTGSGLFCPRIRLVEEMTSLSPFPFFDLWQPWQPCPSHATSSDILKTLTVFDTIWRPVRP